MKLYLLVLLVFLCMESVIAVPNIEISPNPLIARVLQGETSQYTLNITNNGTENVYNITFSNIANVNFPTPIDLQQNESREVVVAVEGISQESLPPSTVTFYYNRSEVRVPETINAVIYSNGNGFIQGFTVYQGDSISFFNNDTVSVDIATFDLSFRETIAPGSSIPVTFNVLGDNNYMLILPDNTQRGAVIQVLPSATTIFTHDASYDKIFTINYEMLLHKAAITIESITPSNFSMGYQEEEAGAIVFTVNDTLYDAHFSGEWFVFEENDYTVGTGVNKVVPFKVTPDIEIANNATGIIYNKIITISSSNADDFNITVPIYIEPYDFGTITSGNITITTGDIIYINWSDAIPYCTANPDMYFCEEFKSIIIPRYEDVKVNASAGDLLKIITDFPLILDGVKLIDEGNIESQKAVSTMYGESNVQVSEINRYLQNLTIAVNSLNNNLELVIGNNEENQSWSDTRWVLTIIIAGGIVGAYLFVKNKMKKDIIMGKQ